MAVSIYATPVSMQASSTDILRKAEPRLITIPVLLFYQLDGRRNIQRVELGRIKPTCRILEMPFPLDAFDDCVTFCLRPRCDANIAQRHRCSSPLYGPQHAPLRLRRLSIRSFCMLCSLFIKINCLCNLYIQNFAPIQLPSSLRTAIEGIGIPLNQFFFTIV